MSLQNVAAIARDIPSGEPLLAAAIVAAAIEDYGSNKEHVRQDAARFLFGDWAADLLQGLGMDAAALRAGLDRHARNKHIKAPKQRRRQMDTLRV